MLPAASSMMRRILTLVVVLLVSGLSPATAVVGFCAKSPCCFGEAGNVPFIADSTSGCCATISCYQAPAQDLAVPAKAKVLIATALGMLLVAAGLQQVSETHHIFDDPSPPPTTSERLSSLSLLRI